MTLCVILRSHIGDEGSQNMEKESRERKHLKIRKKIFGTSNRPRLSVFRSNQHIFAQVIDDTLGKTLASADDLKMDKLPKRQKAYEVGKKLAMQLQKLKIKKVVFDRGGFLYHGRVAELGKGAREGGLDF